MENVVSKIIYLNAAVFFAWMLGPPVFMAQNFVVSSIMVQEGRIWTLLTSVFSHNQLFHIFINMFILWGFGTAMESLMGSRRFLIFYLASGIIASLGHCLSSSLLLDDPTLPALGASGAISAVLVLFSLNFPSHLVYLFGLIPLPAILAAGLFIGSDLLGLIAQSHGGGLPIGYGAHLSGAFAGGFYYFFFWRRRRIGGRQSWRYRRKTA